MADSESPPDSSVAPQVGGWELLPVEYSAALVLDDLLQLNARLQPVDWLAGLPAWLLQVERAGQHSRAGEHSRAGQDGLWSA